MPGLDDLPADAIRDALRLFGEDEATVTGGSRRILRERLEAPGFVSGLIDHAPQGAEKAFRQVAIDGAAAVEDLLGRGWPGVGVLPPPLDWLQRRALVMVGPEGLVHATDAARLGFAALTFDLPEPVPATPAPVIVEGASAVVIASSAAALNQATAVTGAALRAVAPTVAISDRSISAVQAALQSAGIVVSGVGGSSMEIATSPDDRLDLGDDEPEAFTPKAIRAILQRGLAEDRQIRLEYFASSRGGQATERVVDPWRFADDLLRGYCHLRDDERAFALDRMGGVRLLRTARAHRPAGHERT